MPKLNKQNLVNFVGGVAYLTSALNWLLVLMLLLPVLLGSSAYQQFIAPEPAPVQVTAPNATPLPESDSLWVFIGFIIAAVFIIIACLMLIKVPLSIAKTGQKITSKSSQTIAPVLIKHRLAKPASKTKLSASLTKLTKLALAILPAGFGLASQLLTVELETDTVILLTSLIAIATIVLFTIQYYLALWLKVDTKKIL